MVKAEPKPRPWFVFVAGQQLLCQEGGQQFIQEVSAEKPLFDSDTAHLLGIYNNRPCYAISKSSDLPVPSGFEWRTLRSFLGQVSDLLFDLAGRACQIINWDQEHRFCGSCGQRSSNTDGVGGKSTRVRPHTTVSPDTRPWMVTLDV